MKKHNLQELASWCDQQKINPPGLVSKDGAYSLTGEYFQTIKTLYDAMKPENLAIKTWENTTNIFLPGRSETTFDFEPDDFVSFVDSLLADKFLMNKAKSKDLVSLIEILTILDSNLNEEVLQLESSSPRLLSMDYLTKPNKIKSEKSYILRYKDMIRALKVEVELRKQKNPFSTVINTFRNLPNKPNQQNELNQEKSLELESRGLHPVVVIGFFGGVIGFMTLHGISTPEQLNEFVKSRGEGESTEYQHPTQNAEDVAQKKFVKSEKSAGKI
jgi:hypothetical protein